MLEISICLSDHRDHRDHRLMSRGAGSKDKFCIIMLEISNCLSDHRVQYSNVPRTCTSTVYCIVSL